MLSGFFKHPKGGTHAKAGAPCTAVAPSPVPDLWAEPAVPAPGGATRALCKGCGDRIKLEDLNDGGRKVWRAYDAPFGLSPEECRGNSPCGHGTPDGWPVLGPHIPSTRQRL